MSPLKNHKQILEHSKTPNVSKSSFQDKLEEIFSPSGILSQCISGYQSRQSQLDMAVGVLNAISNQTTLLAEAGTGTGKTFAYLVPAMLHGGKVILSTGTKTLQDQLFNKDIPIVRKALKLPISIALLKGRSNYVCHFHLARTLENGRLTSKDDVGYLREISRFVKTTQSGDRSELSRVPENASIWSLVTSTKDNCLGSDCEHASDCFVIKARKEAQQADLVVVNHHLFFADVALKDVGIAELLPAANTVIFDEAHQLPDTATLFFGESISTSQIVELARDLKHEGLAHARDGADWITLSGKIDKAARDLRLSFPLENIKLSFSQIAPDSTFFPALDTLIDTLEESIDVLELQSQRAESLELCRARMIQMHEALSNWSKPSEKSDQVVIWLEAFSHTLQLHRTPLSIADIFNKQRQDHARAWIFTSATMAVKSDFSHYASQMGLWNEPSLVLSSPFDYQKQALLYVPTGLPDPNNLNYSQAVVDAAIPVIHASKGRCFFLCTTLKAVKFTAERLIEIFQNQGWSYPVFVQGEQSRTELLENFRTSGNGVLVGSQSFWEGIDVRGEALSLVIIDKLPFSPPDNPVLAARIETMEKQGLNGFVHHQLPSAIINLKQGAGRLIRDETDQGVLMICDPRIITKNYGKRIWQSLPPFSRTRDLKMVEEFFLKISKASIENE